MGLLRYKYRGKKNATKTFCTYKSLRWVKVFPVSRTPPFAPRSRSPQQGPGTHKHATHFEDIVPRRSRPPLLQLNVHMCIAGPTP